MIANGFNVRGFDLMSRKIKNMLIEADTVILGGFKVEVQKLQHDAA